MAEKHTYEELEKRIRELERAETGRRSEEEILHESEALFREIFDISPIGIVLGIAETQKFLKVNPYGCAILGYTEAELQQMTVRDITPEEDWNREVKMIQARIAGDPSPFIIEKRMINKKGEARWFRVTASAFQSKLHGLRAIAFVQDIHDYKQSETVNAALKARIQRLKKAESLGRMAGAVAHLFNNQLNVILGSLELALNEAAGNEGLRHKLQNAMQAVHRSAEISNLMLTYLGLSFVRTESLDMANVCRRYLPLIQLAAPKGISMETDFLPAGPIIRANEGQLKEILTHLITNAWESMGDRRGKLTVAIKTLPLADIPDSQLDPADWEPVASFFACLEVADTGCGMTEEELEKIFDPFFTTKFPGRGLGLSAIQGIVKSWDGAILVESRKNHGSVFRVLLPVADNISSLSPEKPFPDDEVAFR